MEENEIQGKKGRSKLFTKKRILIIIAFVILLIAGAGIGVIKASDKPAFCASCHNMKPYYANYKDSNLLANKHAKAGVVCHDCHQDTIGKKMGEGVKYVTGDYKTPMKEANFGSREFCLKCHNFDKVKSKTNFKESNPHDSHNGQQECNKCHSMHRKSQVMCSQCHSFNWMNKLDGSWKKD